MFQVMLNQKQIKQNEKKNKKNNKKFPPQKHNKKKKPTRLITALKCNGIEHGF